jgi:hypothetical protein
MTKTKFRPILFSTPMVQAILENRKTMTRRTVKPQPQSIDFYENRNVWYPEVSKCPYQVGDVLWVRENYYTASNWDHWKPSMLKSVNVEVFYVVDSPNYDIPRPLSRGKIRPCIFLPKEYSRIFLKIKFIRIERLQDISAEDAIAEGIAVLGYGFKNYDNIVPLTAFDTPQASFFSLWSKINSLKSLQANPFVWVYEFERIEKPLDFI